MFSCKNVDEISEFRSELENQLAERRKNLKLRGCWSCYLKSSRAWGVLKKKTQQLFLRDLEVVVITTLSSFQETLTSNT